MCFNRQNANKINTDLKVWRRPIKDLEIYLPMGTLIFSALSITVLAGYAIAKDPTNTMTIFNVILPVFASWVGTILAFYFGRENFESANKQVRELVDRLTPEERATAPRQLDYETFGQHGIFST